MNTAKTVELVKSLYHLGKFRLTEKGPELMGEQVVVVPRGLFADIVELYSDNAELERATYEVMKKSVYKFCESLDTGRDTPPAQMLGMLMRLTSLNGYGDIEINMYDEDARKAAFFVKHLPSETLSETADFKGDTYWAGMLAGGMSYVFDENMDCLETRCILEGETSCRFHIARPEVLAEEYPELYREKFGQSEVVQE